jgi:Anaphase-promoting complex, subunit 10 (APC10)
MVHLPPKNQASKRSRKVINKIFCQIRPYITSMNVQLAILQNQHSGKDTHIRQVKIFGPRE